MGPRVFHGGRLVRWVPTFVFGPADALETLRLTLPVGLWAHGGQSMGTARSTATGIPDVSFINRKRLLTIPVRFTEEEWPAVRRLIEWGQTKSSFVWFPESDPYAQDQIVSATVYLEAPRVADIVSPVPDNSYPRVSSIALTFRQIVTGDES